MLAQSDDSAAQKPIWEKTGWSAAVWTGDTQVGVLDTRTHTIGLRLYSWIDFIARSIRARARALDRGALHI